MCTYFVYGFVLSWCPLFAAIFAAVFVVVAVGLLAYEPTRVTMAWVSLAVLLPLAMGTIAVFRARQVRVGAMEFYMGLGFFFMLCPFFAAIFAAVFVVVAVGLLAYEPTRVTMAWVSLAVLLPLAMGTIAVFICRAITVRIYPEPVTTPMPDKEVAILGPDGEPWPWRDMVLTRGTRGPDGKTVYLNTKTGAFTSRDGKIVYLNTKTGAFDSAVLDPDAEPVTTPMPEKEAGPAAAVGGQ